MTVAGSSGRRCAWCGAAVAGSSSRRWCSKRCRQAAWRARRDLSLLEAADASVHVAYADPPYPGHAWRYPERLEVDHRELPAEAAPHVRVAAWCKPRGPLGHGLVRCWEPVLVRRPCSRVSSTPARDFLVAHAARGGGNLPGRKPLAFCRLYPGTGVVWRAFRARGARVLSPMEARSA